MSKNNSKKANKGKKGKNVTTEYTTRPRVTGAQGTRPGILVLEALSGSSAAVRMVGGYPITVSPTDTAQLAAAMAGTAGAVHGMLLTGGGDVNPRLYHRRPHRKVYGVNEARDKAEFLALDYAARMQIPVLGICRGNQIQNVHAGGTLRQHIGGHYGEHEVIAADGSTFQGAIAGRDNCYVQSLHHQEIGRIADTYRISGRAPDGTVEAIESKDGRCLGVQFHPEMHTEFLYARDIFRWLVESAATRAHLPTPPAPEVPRISTYAPPSVVDTRESAVESAVLQYSWCAGCRIRFDKREDYLDHMWIFHDQWIRQDDDQTGTGREVLPALNPGGSDYRETSAMWDAYDQTLGDYEEWA